MKTTKQQILSLLEKKGVYQKNNYLGKIIAGKGKFKISQPVNNDENKGRPTYTIYNLIIDENGKLDWIKSQYRTTWGKVYKDDKNDYERWLNSKEIIIS